MTKTFNVAPGWIKAVGVLTIVLTSSCLSAAELTVVNYGGAVGDAENIGFNQPFAAKTGTKVTAVGYNGEQAKVKAMVEAKHVDWDVVQIETADLGRGCDEGLYEKLDWSKIGPESNFLPGTKQTCGAGIYVNSTVFAYNADKIKGAAPTSWKDFWDVSKYPGKRGMRKGARYNLEFALMADGVPTKDVHKVLATKEGQDRAFKKLDQLKPNIQWWEAGAQPPQFLVAGDVLMSTAYNGRIDAAQKEGKNLKIVWAGSIYDIDYWVIPKGAPNRALSEQYIAYTLTSEAQQAFSHSIAYGPVNLAATAALPPALLQTMPNAPDNIKDAVLQDVTFWTDYGDELETRFASWASK